MPIQLDEQERAAKAFLALATSYGFDVEREKNYEAMAHSLVSEIQAVILPCAMEDPIQTDMDRKVGQASADLLNSRAELLDTLAACIPSITMVAIPIAISEAIRAWVG